MEFLGICIVFSTWLVCDTWIFLRGYNATFSRCKTEDEKELRRLTIAAMRRCAAGCNEDQ